MVGGAHFVLIVSAVVMRRTNCDRRADRAFVRFRRVVRSDHMAWANLGWPGPPSNPANVRGRLHARNTQLLLGRAEGLGTCPLPMLARRRTKPSFTSPRTATPRRKPPGCAPLG